MLLWGWKDIYCMYTIMNCCVDIMFIVVMTLEEPSFYSFFFFFPVKWVMCCSYFPRIYTTYYFFFPGLIHSEDAEHWRASDTGCYMGKYTKSSSLLIIVTLQKGTLHMNQLFNVDWIVCEFMSNTYWIQNNYSFMSLSPISTAFIYCVYLGLVLTQIIIMGDFYSHHPVFRDLIRVVVLV